MLRRDDVRRVTIGLIADEIGRARKRSVELESLAHWSDDTALDEDGLGLDSLARLDCVARVNEMFHLHEVGIEDYLVIEPRLGGWVDIVVEGLSRRFERATFQTSGTTGAPKSATHEVSALVAEVDAVAALLSADGRDLRRTLLWTPPQHIYGFLMGALLPARLDLEVVDLRAAASSALSRAQAGDLVVATPFRWGRALTAGRVLAPGVVGLTATAPSDRALWDSARAAGLARLIEIYGSTETAGVGWRDDVAADFTLAPAWRRDAARADALIRVADGASVDAPDRLAWRGDDRFRPVGRRDAVVQVAGVNVCLETVREAVMASGLAHECAVRPDPETGRLKAFVVPALPLASPVGGPGSADASPRDPVADAATETSTETATDAAAAAIEALAAAAAAALPAPARPTRWTLGAELPRTAAGKLRDWSADDAAENAADATPRA